MGHDDGWPPLYGFPESLFFASWFFNYIHNKEGWYVITIGNEFCAGFVTDRDVVHGYGGGACAERAVFV